METLRIFLVIIQVAVTVAGSMSFSAFAPTRGAPFMQGAHFYSDTQA